MFNFKNIWRKFLLISLFGIILLTPARLLAKGAVQDHQELPLLLSSGLVSSTEGSLEYIVWTEEPGTQTYIEKTLEASGLAWNKKVLSDFSGKKVYQYTTEMAIKKEEEKQAVIFYNHLNTMANNGKIKVLLEERIDSRLEAEKYFTENQIAIKQKAAAEDLISISGYDPRIPCAVQAGKDRLNIQIITEKETKTRKGKTILAIPALMEEF